MKHTRCNHEMDTHAILLEPCNKAGITQRGKYNVDHLEEYSDNVTNIFNKTNRD